MILAVVTLLAVLLSACSGNVKSNDTSAENTTTQVSTSVNETVQTTNAELPKIYNPTNVEIRDNEDENKVIIESSQIEYVCLLDDINGMVLNMKLTAEELISLQTTLKIILVLLFGLLLTERRFQTRI